MSSPPHNPTIPVETIKELTPARRQKILARSAVAFHAAQAETRLILDRLRAEPLAELAREYGPLKPDLTPEDLLVGPEELERALNEVSPELVQALQTALNNIKKFHAAQLERAMWLTEVQPGLLAGRVTRPLARVGVYIPGGRAAYPSSALMNIAPAQVAGVQEIVAVTPPGPGFLARPTIVAAAHLAGATRIYKLGGAWAIGSLAYGLLGLPKVDKIVGPGSSWVTAAKLAVYGEVDIDLPAGPSEGFIIADQSADPTILAWDFLAQLEHDPEAAAVLVTTTRELAQRVATIAQEKLADLDRAPIIQESLKNAAILVAADLGEALALANEYAPEHLQLYIADPLSHLGQVQNAGSVFLGPHSPIPGGDYATGPNHVLPTGGAARSFSGLSTDAFLRKMTFQQLSQKALAGLTPTISALARAEGLTAHALTVEARAQLAAGPANNPKV
ncbi:MAG: histidinol dehydrogenase [Deltaproteobacteria bacterium]|jgi:histidinol dehydrogenase|nr:histidinol dehydrogenase [Deltaproteobacteria bacterium]